VPADDDAGGHRPGDRHRRWVENRLPAGQDLWGELCPYTRDINKPVSGTVLVALDGTPQAAGWTVDETTGVVTFDVGPGNGVAVTAGYEFDVPVRFDIDSIQIDLSHFESGAITDVPVVEIRL
jgi:uncharacterized protein (TIGR02217 family)